MKELFPRLGQRNSNLAELQIARNLFLLEYTGLHIPTISTAKRFSDKKRLGQGLSTCSVSVHHANR
jgi:hypothetical protein